MNRRESEMQTPKENRCAEPLFVASDQRLSAHPMHYFADEDSAESFAATMIGPVDVAETTQSKVWRVTREPLYAATRTTPAVPKEPQS